MTSLENDGSNKQTIYNEAQEEANIYEDEIHLRECIQVIIKKRKLIIGIFLVAVVAAAIVNQFLPKTYQATASIMLMPSRNFLDPETTESKLTMSIPTHKSLLRSNALLGSVINRLAISIPTHKSLLKSNALLESVINRLKSESKWDEDSTREEFSRRLEVADIKESNILQLVAKDKDPGIARDIANIWAVEYAEYSLGIITGEIKGFGDFIESQFTLAKGDLVKAEQAIKGFEIKERFTLMEIESKETTSQLNSHYAKVYELDFTLQEKKSHLAKKDADIAALTKDGMWIGAFDVKELGQKYFADKALSIEQSALRQKALKAKHDLENSRKKRDGFVNDSRIMLLRAEVECKRENLLVLSYT